MHIDASHAPRLSVIVPAHDRPNWLRMALASLAESTIDDWELIIVLDHPTDEVRQVALESGGTVLETPVQSGPAIARNYGAQCAHGEVLAFVDSDVCVHPSTLEIMVEALENEAEIDAVFGSYDDAPQANGFASHFRNLLHHFTHQTSCEEGVTFWAGCGAIRRSVFLQVDGFCPRFGTPSIEDIELGMRLRERGHRIRIVKQAQGTHLKQWTLWSMVRTDLLQRGIPWMQLVLAKGGLPDDLNLKLSQRFCVVLSWIVLLCLIVASFEVPRLAPAAVLLAAMFVFTDRASRASHTAGIIGMVILVCCFAAFTVFALGSYAFLYGSIPAIACIVALNLPLYRCIWHAGGCPVIYAIALHWLYFLTCGIAAAIVIGGKAIGILGDSSRIDEPYVTCAPESAIVIRAIHHSDVKTKAVPAKAMP